MRAPLFIVRATQALAVLCAMALFAWVAAHWMWRVWEPAAPPPLLQSGDGDWSARILAGSALGFSRAETPAAPVVAAAPSTIEGRVRLMGLAREPGARIGAASQALLKIDNKRVLWIGVGEEVDTGITLSAIDPDGIRLKHDGREVRVPLRERTTARPAGMPPGAPVLASAPGASAKPTAAVPASAGAGAPRPGDTCRLQPEQRSRAYVLRPEIIDGVMRERTGWTDLFKSTAVGLVVQNPGGTGAMLGLYANDLLAKVDGAQLGSADDVLRLVLQPLARNESVVVTGSRAGQPREWIYAGMNCLQR